MEKVGEKSKGIAGSYIEITVGGILGVISGLIEQNFALGLTIFCMGFLFSASRLIICRYFTNEFNTTSEIYRLKSKISTKKDKEFVDELIKHERKFLYKLQELAEGTIRYETSGEYHMSAEKQVRETRKSLETTALVNYKQWLESGTLKKYLDEQEKLVSERKINITRIFIWDEDQIKNENDIKIAKMHAEKGINVYVAEKEKIPLTLHDILTKPFAIFDGEVAIMGNLAFKEGKIIKGIKTITPSKIDELKDIFNTIRIHHSIKLKNFLEEREEKTSKKVKGDLFSNEKNCN